MPSAPTPSEAQQVAERIYQRMHQKCIHIKVDPDLADCFEPCITCSTRVLTAALRAREQAVAKACAETAEKQVCAHDCERDYTGRHSAFCAHGIATAIRTRFGVEGGDA